MMALLCRIAKPSESFFRKPSIALRSSLNVELSYSARKIVKIPPPPKKPLTGYMIFCKDHRKELLALTSTEQIKKLAAQWNGLSLDRKQAYNEQARESTVLYGEAHKKYYENLTEEQRQEIALSKAEKKEARRLLKLKKALKEAGLPKSPAQAYPLFVKSQSKLKEIKNATQFVKETAEKWKSLPEDEKKKFQEQAEKEKHRFHNELEKWKKKMITENKSELVQKYENLRKKSKPVDIEEVLKDVRNKKAVGEFA